MKEALLCVLITRQAIAFYMTITNKKCLRRQPTEIEKKKKLIQNDRTHINNIE